MKERRNIATSAKSRGQRRSAMALLVCLFAMTLASSSLVGILGAMTADLAALRNTTDYERALYLAGAGAHHALAELEADSSWTTGISNTPSTGTQFYSATVATQGDGSVIITGIGVSGSVTRRVAVTVDFGD